MLLCIQQINIPMLFDDYWGSVSLKSEKDYNQNCYLLNSSLYYPFLEENKINNYYLHIELKRTKILERLNIFQEKLLPYNVYGKY